MYQHHRVAQQRITQVWITPYLEQAFTVSHLKCSSHLVRWLRSLSRRRAHLDVTHGLLGLRHAYGLGRVLIGQHLCAAQVVSCEYDSVDEVLWLTGAWD